MSDRNGGYLRIVRTGFQKGVTEREKAFIELLGSEQELDEKRQKRAEARAKRREEIDKAMSEPPPAEGSGENTLTFTEKTGPLCHRSSSSVSPERESP